jgi:monoterpene epsilon-lactone hydrolase
MLGLLHTPITSVITQRIHSICHQSLRTTGATILLSAAGLFFCAANSAQQKESVSGPQNDTSIIASDGTAHVTRVVPVPVTISPEAQRLLARPVPDEAAPQSLSDRRKSTDAWQTKAGEVFRKLYPADVQLTSIAGVPVKVITPAVVAATHRDHVLINLHGGGFNSDSGSLTESVPVAYFSQTKVIAVLYRLAPENPFPAGLEDAIAVYREELKTYRPQNIGIFGASAGAILTAEVAAKLRQSGLPLPGALGIFSGFGDWSQHGDSEALFALRGLSGHLDVPEPRRQGRDEYAANTDLKDPVLSPLYSDLRGFPPSLFVTSGRDTLLSGTTILHRAFLRAGVDAQLVVFEALPHAFWNDDTLPETREADQIMGQFFSTHLGCKPESKKNR